MSQLQTKQCKTCTNTIDEYKTFCNDCIVERKRIKDRIKYYDKKEKRLRNIQRECSYCGKLFIPSESPSYVYCSEFCKEKRTKELQKKNKRFKRLPEMILRLDKNIESQYLKLQNLQNKKINLCAEYESLKLELGRSA